MPNVFAIVCIFFDYEAIILCKSWKLADLARLGPDAWHKKNNNDESNKEIRKSGPNGTQDAWGFDIGDSCVST